MATATETWFYAGRRVAKGGKSFLSAWVDQEGVERYYKALPAGSIGSAYTVDVTREDDRVSVVPTSLRFADWEHGDDDAIAGWKVEDAAAYQEIEAKRAEKRAAEDDEVQDALDVLRRHFQASKSYSAKWAFAQWCAAEIARKPRA